MAERWGLGNVITVINWTEKPLQLQSWIMDSERPWIQLVNPTSLVIEGAFIEMMKFMIAS
jgi:hypothetical protein